MIKRLLDIILSAFALMLLSPILLPVMVILKFTGEGEVFYRQERVGKGNKVFRITKFATMLKESPNIGTGEYTLRNDPRVLPFGRFLRKSKINELPQLWDILIGQMSFIGPRPQMVKVTAWYPEEYKLVLDKVRPGLSGIGSVIFRDEEKIISETDDYETLYRNHIIPYKAVLEKWYCDNVSLGVDLKLFLLTIWVVISPDSDLVYRVFPTLPTCDSTYLNGLMNLGA